MSEEVEAIYQNGVFLPVEPVDLPEQQRVMVRLPSTKEQAQENDRPEEVSEDVEPIWRGVFATEPEREAVLEELVQVKVQELPSLEPTVDLNSRWFEEDDE